MSITVRIDRQEPDGDIRFEGTSVKQSIRLIPFNQFFNHDIAVEITGTDELSGVDKVEYYRSSEVLPKPKSSGQKFVHMCDYLASRKGIELQF